MAQFKCVACNTRQHGAARPADLVGDLCPGCGASLEPVGGPPGRHQQIADRVDVFFARREPGVAEARLEAERWLDDGGRATAEAGVEA